MFAAITVLGLLGATPASAQDTWSTYAAAFPLFPCQDGWMGCMSYGQHVDSELRRDPAGRALPSDARIGWFDLQATASFSPFTGLSTYESNDGVAAAATEEPEPVEAAPAPDGEDDAVAEAEAERIAAREQARSEAAARQREMDAEAARKRQDEANARKLAADAERRAAQADAAEQARLQKEAAAAQAKAAEMERQRKAAEDAAAKQRAAEEAARKRAEQEDAAKRAEADKLRAAELAAQAKAVEDARIAAEKAAASEKPAPTAAAPAPIPTGDCSDNTKLEPYASLGKLTDDLIQCLEVRLANAPKMTDKKKISALLMADAWAKGNKEQWEVLVKRHLDEIDQSDPDLCYKYALHLSRQGPGRASGVIRWANVALENRMVWIGETYTSRVFSLYKVRAAASQSLWQQAEEEHKAAPTDETREKVEKYRNMTKVNAREWYEYARDAGKDSSTALQLCMSAAGTADYCEAG